MNSQKWEYFKKAARGEEFAAPPVALIVDSPWIPGYLGISTLDYLTEKSNSHQIWIKWEVAPLLHYLPCLNLVAVTLSSPCHLFFTRAVRLPSSSYRASV